MLCIAGVLGLFLAILTSGESIQTSAGISVAAGRVLIIDPGHGGEDGGAVSANGTVESHINLAIGRQMDRIARLMGQTTVMTRSEDISIYDDGCQTLRQKKVSDLHNRVSICNSTQGGVLISIHQNSLPDKPGVQGAQVFYNAVSGSQELAQAVQQALNDTVNGEHPKDIKKIPDSIYLMKNVTCPAILIECGFLSNAAETERLSRESYQTVLAMVILSAVMENAATTLP